MIKYKKTYCKAFGYDPHPDTFIPSELSGNEAVDIHHIVTREDRIENLMALTRTEHMEFGEIKSAIPALLTRHRLKLKKKNIDYDNEWFEKYINQYSIYE